MLGNKSIKPHTIIRNGENSPTLPYTVNEPFNNYFFYKNGPNIGKPLVNGTIEFYSNSDHNLLVDTYSDISDPLSPVVNPNPFTLGADGSSAGGPYPSPVFYMQSQIYYIVIKSQEGQVQWTLPNFEGVTFGGSDISGGLTENLIANGQFDWPVNFSLPNAVITGQILNPTTNVALAWQFLQPVGATTNIVSFNSLANLSIEGNPQQEIVLTSTATSPESVKDFVATYGGANSFDSQPLTFSAQFVNKQTGSTPISIILEQNYGVGGSPSVFTTIEVLQVGNVRDKYVVPIQVPSSAGMNFGPGNYAAIHIQGSLGQFCNFGMTNCLLQLGALSDPIYIGQSDSAEKAQILGAITDISQAGWATDYFPETYQGGYIYPLSNTGHIVTASTLNPPPNGILLTGSPQSLPVTGATNGIPNLRLYNALGSTSDTGLLATSKDATTTVTSVYGFRPSGVFTAGTAPVTVTQTTAPLLCGVTCAIGSSPNIVSMTFADQFAPNPTPAPPNVSGVGGIPAGAVGSLYKRARGDGNFPAGNQAIIPTVIAPGSVSTNCVVDLLFGETNISNYRTTANGVENPGVTIVFAQYNTLEFSSFASPSVRGNYTNAGGTTTSPIGIIISVDGTTSITGNWSGSRIYGGSQQTVTVPFLSSLSLPNNIKRFMQSVANPGVWTFLFNSVPTAGEYVKAADGTTQYAPWFKVNGSGTAPVGEGTAIEIDITTPGDTTTTCAAKLATALNALIVTIPATACAYSSPFADYILQ